MIIHHYWRATFVVNALEWAADNKSILRTLTLACICLLAFAIRLYSIVRFESVIHEFDPWFNYRATQQLVEKGWDEFIHWFDDKAWYPLGRDVGGSVFPGLMVTSALAHGLLNKVMGFPIDVREVCVFLGPVVSMLTVLSTYHLTVELKNGAAGLLAALIMAICPGYIARSVGGSYDNEAISIFLMTFTFLMWIRASKTGSAVYATVTAMSYFYMVASWGGYAYIINLIPLHVFALLCMNRYSHKLYVSYSTFYVLGTVASMTVPFVNTAPIRTSEHVGAFGVFGLVQLFAFSSVVRESVAGAGFRMLMKLLIGSVAILGAGAAAVMSTAGLIAPWAGRFQSLWDPNHAKEHAPLIASVAEHQPTTWSAFFVDFNWLIYMLPIGMYYCLRRNGSEHVFGVLYGLTASYFAAVMVRLELTLAPMVSVAAGLAVTWILDQLMGDNEPAASKDEPVAHETKTDAATAGSGLNQRGPAVSKPKEKSGVARGDWISTGLVLLPLMYHCALFLKHATWLASTSYSSPSIILAASTVQGNHPTVVDDFREGFYWLRKNTRRDARILAWWDYGYQITGMSDRTTMVDNNTWDFHHIAQVGRILIAEEEQAYPMMRALDADYVLVLSGSLSGFMGDDLNKMFWMARIAAGEFPGEVNESAYINSQGAMAFGPDAPAAVLNSVLQRAVNYNLDRIGGQLQDRVRKVGFAETRPFRSLEEVFSSERFVVRIFRVRAPDVLGRALF